MHIVRDTYIKIITCIALIAIFFLQGIWLYNTYTFFDQELKNNFDNLFAKSIEREIFLRLENTKSQRKSGDKVDGTKPGDDTYSIALAFHEFLLTYNNTLLLDNLDSIWQQELINNDITSIKYSLAIIDSTNNIIQQINQGIESKNRFCIYLKKPIRRNHSEYIQVIIESPHKIVLERMLLLLIASLAMAIITGYCFYLQIRIIMRQNRIAEIRQDFTNAMVHDMKNPITTILMSVNALKGGQLDNKAELKKQYFEIILKEGDHLLSLANKALTIAKFEDHKITLTKSNIDVKELFGKLINKYQLTAIKKVKFITELNDLPTIYADPEYINEVFDNLIDNAIKYSKESVTIRITSQKENNNTLISVEDNGIGISANDQKRIFKKFERILSKNNEKTSGFGLGLNYVYQIVKAHGGDIKIESTPDQYSKFTIIIPNKKDD